MSKGTERPVNARGVAAGVVENWLITGRFPERLLSVETPSRAFVYEVVQGISRMRAALDWLTAACCRRTPESEIMAYIYVGSYQLFFMHTVPAHAAIDETIKAVKAGRRKFAAGFVNAVLRRMARDKATLQAKLAQQPLHVRASFPEALIQRWTVRYGAVFCEQLCGIMNEVPQVCVLPNPRKTTTEALLERWLMAGVAASLHPAAAGCLMLPHGLRIDELPGFHEGLFTVQDPSTRLAVDVLAPVEGDCILDACCAPGGKTLLMAQRVGAGRVVGLDVSEVRLRLAHENAARLCATNISLTVGDARDLAVLATVAPPGGFDRILLDVPCSNTGVLRRRPDARWRFSLTMLQEVGETQRALLDAVAPFLKPGGRMVYSTCSMEPEENEERITAWLGQQPAYVGCGFRSYLPHVDGMDGAFAAVIERR
jgi:16S rRNA (cytosine967-C5)-methyltransferase